MPTTPSSECDAAILATVESYYTEKIQRFGADHRAVDWNSSESQMLRFAQVTRVCDLGQPFSVLDYGCGYGALVDYLDAQGTHARYTGYDISDAMRACGEERYLLRDDVQFTGDLSTITEVDYVVASGVFSVRMGFDDDHWSRYVFDRIDEFASRARCGFAFNMLTAYSDADRMRPDLYYADPLAMFDAMRRRYSRRVALLHDYPLYEFTIVVRTDA